MYVDFGFVIHSVPYEILQVLIAGGHKSFASKTSPNETIPVFAAFQKPVQSSYP